MTRDDIAKGPVFKPERAESATPWTLGREVCACCAACAKPMVTVDDTTGLCRPCWRVWRFTTGILHAEEQERAAGHVPTCRELAAKYKP